MPTLDPVLPTPEDSKLANEASRNLLPLLGGTEPGVRILLPHEKGEPEETIILPRSAVQLLQNLLTQMARGNAVSLVPQHAELTTNQAADVLGVSRPYLVNELLEKGEIPYHRVGTHRRIAFADLMEYRKKIDERHEEAMQKLANIAQEEGGMGY
ncbi:DNA-binding protein [Coraliomargarita sinensis]|uniref:DNA-binding protein n=2 Tax=Coraliomargarita sinensis TaxID=2174842 RepID=A0A317ZJB4_9BACT|nr:DNA-binding protein [Coraliomargarita sinensis]